MSEPDETMALQCRMPDWALLSAIICETSASSVRSDEALLSRVRGVQGNIQTYMISARDYNDLHEEIERLTQKLLKRLVQPLVQNGLPHFVFVIQGFRAWVGSTRYFWIQAFQLHLKLVYWMVLMTFEKLSICCFSLAPVFKVREIYDGESVIASLLLHVEVTSTTPEVGPGVLPVLLF